MTSLVVSGADGTHNHVPAVCNHMTLNRHLLYGHAVAETLRSLIAALKEAFSRPPTAPMLIDRYAKLCLIVDEVINEARDECPLTMPV
jgi:hypothetical protein